MGINELIASITEKLQHKRCLSQKGIMGIIIGVQSALLQAVLEIEQFIQHDNPTHDDVLEVLSVVSNKIEEIALPKESIDDILSVAHKIVSLLEDKQNEV